MPLYAKATGSTFKPAPAGPAMARCCDVVDMGMVKQTFAGETKVKHVCRIVWQLADPDPETGKRPIVQKRYTVSLHEKAALRHDLESWRSRPFTEQELAGFDVEKVIGVPAFLNIVHAHKDGSTYANVMAVMPPPKGTSVPPVADYVRVCDRQPEPGADDQGETATEITDDDCPF